MNCNNDQQPKAQEQWRVACQAVEDYDYGRGVSLAETDEKPFDRSTSGNEWTIQVRVEFPGEGEGGYPVTASEWLTFTLIFDEASGGLSEAFATGAGGKIWGKPVDRLREKAMPATAIVPKIYRVEGRGVCDAVEEEVDRLSVKPSTALALSLPSM